MKNVLSFVCFVLAGIVAAILIVAWAAPDPTIAHFPGVALGGHTNVISDNGTAPTYNGGAWPGGGGGSDLWTNSAGSLSPIGAPTNTLFWAWNVDSSGPDAGWEMDMDNGSNSDFFPYAMEINIHGTGADFASGINVNLFSKPETGFSLDGLNVNAAFLGITAWQALTNPVSGLGIGVLGSGAGDYSFAYGVTGYTDSHATATNQNAAGVIGYNYQLTTKDPTSFAAAIAGYRTLESSLLNMEDTVALFDNGDSGSPIMRWRTANGTGLGGVNADGTISAVRTNQWALGPQVLPAGVTNLTFQVDGQWYRVLAAPIAPP